MATRDFKSENIQISPSAEAVGFWSAVLSTAFSLTYVVGQLAEWQGLLGSQGGPPLGLSRSSLRRTEAESSGTAVPVP